MTGHDTRLGSDLRLVGDLEVQDHRDRGGDLFVEHRPASGRLDLMRLSGRLNLQQALMLRFLTAVGDLAHLGHPHYGSRLHELVGEPNTETTRNRAKLFALQALQGEPRVAQVTSVVVEWSMNQRDRIRIRAQVVTIDDDTPVNLVFPVDLAGGAS